MNIQCCVACGLGKSSTPQEEVKQQEKKHGEYICKYCESRFENILSSEEELLIKTGFGISESLITQDNIYYFEADRGRVMDPSAPFLGYGGQWFLIRKRYGNKYKMIVSNNLFHSTRIPASYSKRFLEAGKIDSVVIGVGREELAALRDSLNNIPYIK